MKRTRKTVRYNGLKIRVLGWGRSYSAWLFAKNGKKLVRVGIVSGNLTSKEKAIKAGKIYADILAA